MYKLTSKLALVFSLLVSITACEKALFDEDLSSTDPFQNFDYLWEECNEKYAYFELKNIDWDQVKVDYRSRLYSGMSQDSLFNVMGGMLSELRDDHTNLISDFNISSFGVIYLSQDNFDWRLIVDNYIGQDFYRSGPFSHDFIEDGTIGYVRFPSFRGSIDENNLGFILDRYRDTKGLILDLRENGGGAVSDVFNLLSRFVDTRTLTNYTRIKNGPGQNDFSEIEEVYLRPTSGTKFTKKVILLTDRGTYSAGSFTALAAKAIPNITLMGDTTGGGLGLPNGGELPNAWRYRFSTTQALSLDFSPAYENGVPPDIRVQIDWSEPSKDEILERAILELQ